MVLFNYKKKISAMLKCYSVWPLYDCFVGAVGNICIDCESSWESVVNFGIKNED